MSFGRTISQFGLLPVFSSSNEFCYESGKEQGRGCCTIAMLSGLKELKIVAQEIRDFLLITSIFKAQGRVLLSFGTLFLPVHQSLVRKPGDTILILYPNRNIIVS